MKKIYFSTTLAAGAMLALVGCRTATTSITSPLDNPSLAGGWMVSETAKYKGRVGSIETAQRKMVLHHEDGIIRCRIGPTASAVPLRPGDEVKATVLTQRAIFPLKKGPAPSAGAGVKIAEIPEWSIPGGLVLQTVDYPAKVLQVDPSYRLLTLEFEDGHTKIIKTGLNSSLEDVRRGDQVVVREMEVLITQLKSI